MDVPRWVSTFAWLALLLAVVMATKSEEIKDNQISIRFDEVSLTEWNENANNPTNKFVMAVAASVTTYCSGNDCSLGANGMSSVPFTNDNVMILDGYPADENADVQIVFYVSIANQNKSSDGNQYALEKTTLEVILNDKQADIENATSYQVVFIGEKRVGKPLDGTMNSIMIPLAIAVLVFLVFTTLCLHFNEKRQDKKSGLVTTKRADIPSNDAHEEGIVLTAINKNSVVPVVPSDLNLSKKKNKASREQRRKKKYGSSENGSTPDPTGSATTTQHIDVHPNPKATGTSSAYPTPDPQQEPPLNGSRAAQNTNTNSNKNTEIHDTTPGRAKKDEGYRSRGIEPPLEQDGAEEFLTDYDGASHFSNLSCIGDTMDEHSGDYHNSQLRAVDKEYLIQPEGSLPPLATTLNSSSPAIEL